MTFRLLKGFGVLGSLAAVSAVTTWASDSSCSLVGALGGSVFAYAGLMALFALTIRYEGVNRSERPKVTFGVGMGLVILGGCLWFGSDVGEALGCSR